jgi:hypothetical protein
MELNAWWSSSGTPFFQGDSKLGERKRSCTKYDFQKVILFLKIYSSILNAMAQSINLNGLMRKGYDSALTNL